MPTSNSYHPGVLLGPGQAPKQLKAFWGSLQYPHWPSTSPLPCKHEDPTLSLFKDLSNLTVRNNPTPLPGPLSNSNTHLLHHLPQRGLHVVLVGHLLNLIRRENLRQNTKEGQANYSASYCNSWGRDGRKQLLPLSLQGPLAGPASENPQAGAWCHSRGKAGRLWGRNPPDRRVGPPGFGAWLWGWGGAPTSLGRGAAGPVHMAAWGGRELRGTLATAAGFPGPHLLHAAPGHGGEGVGHQSGA